METTLEAALDRLFGSGTTRGMRLQVDVPGPGAAEAARPDAGRRQPRRAQPSATVEALAAEAREHYDRAIAAQRDGNWAVYGEEIKKLGAVLERMAK